MANTVLSQVGRRYILAKESEFGTKPLSVTQLDFGLMQEIQLTEDDSLERVNSINTGHTSALMEEGLYNGSISFTTQPTQPALTNILEGILGDIDLDTPEAGKYTVTTSPITSEDLSYFLTATDSTGKVWEVTGIHITEATLNFSKGSINSIDLTGVFKKAEVVDGTISPATNISNPYQWLDTKVAFGTENMILESLSLTLNWNASNDDGRGIEAVSEGERRLIQRVIRHRLVVSGNFESEALNDELNKGYEDELTSDSLVIIMSRGTDNEQTFTVSGVKLTNKQNTLNTENELSGFSADFEGLDVSVEGDIYSDS